MWEQREVRKHDADHLGWGQAIVDVLSPVLSPVTANPFLFVAVLCVFPYLLRVLIIEQNTELVVVMAIFGGLMAAGINLYIPRRPMLPPFWGRQRVDDSRYFSGSG